MKRLVLIAAIAALFASACAHGLAKGPLPPGQVQKATGFNPASGKMK